MKRLQEIATQKTLNVQLKYTLNEAVIDKNFQAIIDCLKDLGANDEHLRSEVKSVNQRTGKCQKDIQKILAMLTAMSGNKVEAKDIQLQNRQLQVSASDLQSLQKKLEEQSERNKKNNLQTLKDINLLLSDVKQLKRKMDQMGGRMSLVSQEGTSASKMAALTPGQDLQNIRILQNQLQRQLELINKLNHEIDKLKRTDQLHNQRLSALESQQANLRSDFEGNGGLSADDVELLRRLQSKIGDYDKALSRLDIIEQKVRLTPSSDDMEDRFNQLNHWITQLQEAINQLQSELDQLKNRTTIQDNKDSALKQTAAKQQVIKETSRREDSEHEKEHKQIKQAIKQLYARLQQLESGFRESKQKIGVTSLKEIDDQPKDKMLPSINKRPVRIKRQSNYRDTNSKDHSGVLKDSGSKIDWDRKLLQIKTQLQQWLRQLLQSKNLNAKKDDEFMRDLQLKIQEIKMGLEKKADQEGVKKYFSYLDTKVNQLFVMLSQPQSEDALIARKGWGCLSCAKKLEKYKGRLGEHLNWNNLTTTNYSPPRIGFTQTQVNHRSGGERGRFNNEKHSFNYEDTNEQK